MSHYIVKCKCCDAMISQCRCPAKNREIRFDICSNCKNKNLSLSDLIAIYECEDKKEGMFPVAEIKKLLEDKKWHCPCGKVRRRDDASNVLECELCGNRWLYQNE